MQPVLIIHGGAGRKFEDPKRAFRVKKKISRILSLAYPKLLRTNALEAVAYAVKLLEDDPEFNAGTGSQLQADGKARLSAALMDGSRRRFAAVINLEKIKNPILVAQMLLEEEDRVLAGEGALNFARERGLKPEDPRTKASIQRWKENRVIARQSVPNEAEAITKSRLLRLLRRLAMTPGDLIRWAHAPSTDSEIWPVPRPRADADLSGRAA